MSGSLVINSAGDGFTFIKTGGVLAPDTYTVTCAVLNGFKDTAGLLLDGNGDGTAGDNYTGTFTVATPPSNAVTVSLPDLPAAMASRSMCRPRSRASVDD